MAWNVTEVIDSGGGGDRLSLAAFQSAHTGDTPVTGALTGQLKGVATDGTLYWTGWQSGQSASLNIVVEADPASSAEADGINDATGDKALITGRMWVTEADAMYMDWRHIEFSGSGRLSFYNDGGGIENVAKCVFRDSATLPGVETTNLDSALTINVGGCLLKDRKAYYSGQALVNDADATMNLVNNTVVGADTGGDAGIEQVAGTATAKNCALGNNTVDVSGTWSETTNLSEDDAELSMTDGVDFTEPSTDDYTVVASGALDGAGTTEAASWFTTLCATDFAGTPWADPPSAGCFEVPGGAPAFIPKISIF